MNGLKRAFVIGHNPFVCLWIVLIWNVFLLPQVHADEPAGKQVSQLREYAYDKSGEWLYESLSRIHWPKTRALTREERPFQIPVDWKKQAAENKEGFPYLYPCAVDYSANTPPAIAVMTCYRIKYYSHAKKFFDDYLQRITTAKCLGPKSKGIIFQQAEMMRDKAMVFYASFDQAQVQCVYYPGIRQFKGGYRHQLGKWLPGITSDEKEFKKTDYALIQNSKGLLGIWNGTFDREDNFVWWNKDAVKRRYAGLQYDGRSLLPPQPEMATFALYEGGRTVLGTYQNLPNKGEITTFVQNRFMVMENGKPGKDEFPDAYCSFYDNIARSYLFTDKHHRIGVIWTLYTPPSVLVPLAQEMGIENMMLMDIHSPVAATFSDPEGPYEYDGFRDYMKRSFDLVPNFFRLYPLRSSIVWLSKALQSRIQNHYVLEAFRNGFEDHFALFLKGSPEAQRVEKKSETLPDPLAK
jgi:hypothetical protein